MISLRPSSNLTRCCTFVDQQRDVLFYLPLKEGQSYAKACNLKIKKAAKKGNRVLEDYFVKEIDQDKFMVGTGNIRIIKKSNGGKIPKIIQYKPNHCAACGFHDNLTCHHVIPRRHLHLFPDQFLYCLNNRIVLCIKCHKAIEKIPELKMPSEKITCYHEFKKMAYLWKEHVKTHIGISFIENFWDILKIESNYYAKLESGYLTKT